MARILTEESSLTKRRKSLEDETRALQNLLRFELGGAIALLAIGVMLYLWLQHTTTFYLGLAAAVFYVAHRIRIQQNSREEKIVQAGLRGEVEVTRQLAEQLDNSHYIFNDLRIKLGRKSAQIDHLIICPRGIFAIETKNWRGHIEGSEEEERWIQTKDPDTPPIKVFNPIKQTQRHVEILRGVLERSAIDWADIYSIVIFLSPRTTFSVPGAVTPVLKPNQAVEYIANHQGAPKTYSEDEITAVINLLMRNK